MREIFQQHKKKTPHTDSCHRKPGPDLDSDILLLFSDSH